MRLLARPAAPALAVMLSALALSPAFGYTIDGTRDAGAIQEAVQGAATNFGDASQGQPDFTNGSELDVAWASWDGANLYLFLGGNLESNYNDLEIFIDCKAGGQNRLRGNNAVVDANGLNRMGDDGTGNGLTFDADFSPDYWITVQGGNSGGGFYSLFANYAELPTNGGGVGLFLGETGAVGIGTLFGGTNPYRIQVGIDNRNVAGVTGGCGSSSGLGITRGIELLIPSMAIGCPDGPIKVCTFVNGQQHDYVSNQALGSLPPGTCNLGEPRNVNFSAIAGNQYFEVACSGCVPLLGAAQTYAASTQPSRVAAGDFNNDGRLDLVTALDGTVSVLLESGDGMFGPSIPSIAGTGVGGSPAVADFDHDGRLDVAFVGPANAVSVLLGKGDGTFGAGTVYGTANAPQWVATGDLNGDGIPDLVTANAAGGGSPGLSVLLGHGDGTFAAKQDYAPGDVFYEVAIGDLNGDSKPDLAAPYFNGSDGQAFVLLGNGDGTFGAPASFPTGGNTSSWIAIGDVNGDGKLDLVSVSTPKMFVYDFWSASALLGHGDGTFDPPIENVVGEVGPDYAIDEVALADVDLDGKLDIVVPRRATPDRAGTLVEHGNGDGTFGGPCGLYGPSPSFVCVADLNSDGGPDLAVTPDDGSPIAVLLDTHHAVAAPLPRAAGATASMLCFPNPSRHGGTIRFTTARTEDVSVRIVDVTGREVALLARGAISGGTHSEIWDGRDERGGMAAPGVYECELRVGPTLRHQPLEILR